MNKTSYSLTFVFFFIIRNFSTINYFFNTSTLIVSFIIGFILLILMEKYIHISLDKKLVKFVYTILISVIFFLVLKHSVLFASENYFTRGNIYIIGITLIFLAFYIGKQNLFTISSLSTFLFYIFTLFFIILIIGIIPHFSFSKLSFELHIPYFFFLFILIIYPFRNQKKELYRGYFLAFIISLIETILLSFSLGNIDFSFFYSENFLFQSISFFSFLGNIETLLSTIFLFENIITLSIIIYIFLKKIKNRSYTSTS